MTCCDEDKHRGYYRALTPSGWPRHCKKCGRARTATADEAKAAEEAQK